MNGQPRYPALAAFHAACTDADRERSRERAMAEADARDWELRARDLDRHSSHSAAVCRRTAAKIAPWLVAVLNPATARPATPPSKTAARRAREEAHLERTLARTLTSPSA
jgi:hypothetical protein